MFQITGAAELITSYFETLQKLYELFTGELKYGLEETGGDVNRDPQFNAQASNRIIEQKVIPYILESVFGTVPEIVEILKRRFPVFLDYGSGGAENVCRVMKARTDIGHCYGLDVSPGAVTAGQVNVDRESLHSRVSLFQGDITNAENLQTIREDIRARGGDPDTEVITAISAIMHDIGPELTRKFLAAHREVFPNAPIIVTENFKVPQEILNAHPEYQPLYFQFLHEISGQHLYTEVEFRELLAECGYKIVSERTHSSVPSINNGDERIITAITWVIIPEK